MFAAPGKYMQEGLELYLKEHNNTLGGMKVEVDVADDQGNPSVGLTQIRKLVEQDHVDVIFGPLSAAVGSAIVPYIEQHKIAAVYPIVSSDDLTQRTPSDYVLRTEWTSSQPTHVLGDYAYKTLKYRKVATIAFDFSFGWESLGGFIDTFQRDGGKITKQVWTPLVTSDYSPYLSALPRDVDAVMCSYSGAAAVNFIKQYKAFGLKMPLICQGNTTDESTLQDSPDAVGMITALQYSASLKNPNNDKFVAAYTKAYGHEPSYYAEGTYVGAQYLDRGLAAVKGNTADAVAFVKASARCASPMRRADRFTSTIAAARCRTSTSGASKSKARCCRTSCSRPTRTSRSSGPTTPRSTSSSRSTTAPTPPATPVEADARAGPELPAKHEPQRSMRGP